MPRPTRDPKKPPSVYKNKAVWLKWIENNPELLHLVPENKMPIDGVLSKIFEQNPDKFDVVKYRACILSSSIEKVCLTNRHRLQKYVHLLEPCYIRRMVISGLVDKEDIPSDIQWWWDSSMYSSDIIRMLKEFGEEYVNHLPFGALKYVQDEEVIDLLRIHPSLTLRLHHLGLYDRLAKNSNLALRIRRTTPDFDKYYIALFM